MRLSYLQIHLALVSIALLVACAQDQEPLVATVQSGSSSRMEALLDEIGVTSSQLRLFREARDQMADDRLLLAQTARDSELDILSELRADIPDRWWLTLLLAVNADSRRSFAHDRLDAVLDLFQMLDSDKRAELIDLMMRRIGSKGRVSPAAETRRLGDTQGRSLESMLDEIGASVQQCTVVVQVRSRLHELHQTTMQTHRTGRTEMLDELRNEIPDEVWLHSRLDDRVSLLEGLSYSRLDSLIQLRQTVDEVQWSTIEDRFVDRLALIPGPGSRAGMRDVHGPR